MGDEHIEAITSNRERIAAMEKCTDEIHADLKEIRTDIREHLIHMVPPRLAGLLGIMATIIGSLFTAIIFLLRGL